MKYFYRYQQLPKELQLPILNGLILSIILSLGTGYFSLVNADYISTNIPIMMFICSILLLLSDYISINFKLIEIIKMISVVSIIMALTILIIPYSTKLIVYIIYIIGGILSLLWISLGVRINELAAKRYPNDVAELSRLRVFSWTIGSLIGLGISSIIMQFAIRETLAISYDSTTIYMICLFIIEAIWLNIYSIIWSKTLKNTL